MKTNVRNIEFALANSATDPIELVLDNEATIDDEGWCLIAPFGEWPKTRIFREGGQVKEQKFIQVLDNESADAMVGKENSFFSKLKRALVGIPVFKGHGDLNDVDPKAISNEKTKIKLGVVDQIRKGVRGIEAHFALDNDGAEAVKAGYKFPSGFWYVLPNGTRDGAILAKPFKLISVALTQFPNISGVESLANARQTTPAASGPAKDQQQAEKNNDMKQLLIGWLAAQGIALANDATDQAVFDAFNKEMLNRSTSITALGNEKNTLTSNVTSLTADRDAQKKLATDHATALANEQTARKADRKAAADVIGDTAIRLGIKTVADRDATITALENSTDFAKDSEALLKTAPATKTTANGRDVSGKQSAALNNEQAQTQAEYNSAFNVELPLANQDPVKAHRAVMTKPCYAGLAAKLAPKMA